MRDSFLPEISKEKEMERQHIIDSLHHPVRENYYITPGTKIEVPIPEKSRERHEQEKERRAKSRSHDARRNNR